MSFSQTFSLAALGGVLSLVSAATPAIAVPITSNEFSLGFGHRNNGNSTAGVWDDQETGASNTPVSGDFALSVDVTGTYYSSRGPTFAGRTLGNSSGMPEDFSGNSDTLLITLTASYTGSQPVSEITLELDSLSIYGASTQADGQMRFEETTAGNEGFSDAIALKTLGGASTYRTASNYTQLVWNPNDPTAAVTTITRTFAIDAAAARAVDGLEFTGRIVAVPEPGSLALLGLGAGLMLTRRRAAL